MHEVGHCMGFRHSDWGNRASCGGGGIGETRGPIGAVHIPNTPVKTRHTVSVMAACYDPFESGTWTPSDVVAWRNLY
jgi:hypothetical protein